MNERIKEFRKKPGLIFSALGKRGFWNWMPDKMYLKILHRALVGEKLDLKNPSTYMQKIQWLKLYDRKPEYTQYADKYEVRKHIKETIGEQYLVPLIGVWNSVDEIPFEELPQKFVLKCTHDSGSVIICKNKEEFDINLAKTKLSEAMKRNYYTTYREWVYKDIKPRIVAEEYLQELESEELIDYKVMCFNGEARVVQVHKNRFGEKVHTTDYFDINWNRLNMKTSKEIHFDGDIDRPEHFDEMMELSEKLAKDMLHVRVDWYDAAGKLLFGELTFYESAGVDPYGEEAEARLAGWLHLPKTP